MVLSMERWEGKVAVVTGASAGIGASICKSLVTAGVIVVGLARRKDRVEALAKTLQPSKGRLFSFQVDVTKEADILKAFEFARTLGPIHILVNNAGIGRNTNLSGGNTAFWREVFEVNVIGLCVATREALKDMKANAVDGHIVHISSVAGHKVSFPSLNVYSASKFAVKALTETLRLELVALGSKVKVSSVSPGAVLTEFFDANNLTDLKEAVTKIPILTSEDVSDAVMYVLSTPPHVQVHELIVKPVGEAF